MQSKIKPLIVSLVLFAALVAVGYSAITSSSYMDVSALKNYRGGERVIVEGRPALLGVQKMYMVVNSTLFELEAHGVYGVADYVKGPRIGDDNSYAVFVLQGRDGSSVVALYSAREFIAKYGSRVEVSERVVVEGVYSPNTRVIIYDATGKPLGEYPAILVSKILEGCHESYQQPVGTIRR